MQTKIRSKSFPPTLTQVLLACDTQGYVAEPRDNQEQKEPRDCVATGDRAIAPTLESEGR